jgi:hypothetical protein
MYKPRDAIVGACGRDDRATVGVADKKRRAADSPKRALHCGDIACERVEAVLRCHHLVPVRLKRRD